MNGISKLRTADKFTDSVLRLVGDKSAGLGELHVIRNVRRSEGARKGSANFIAIAWCDLLGVPNEFKLSE